jgi:hypothetical protein
VTKILSALWRAYQWIERIGFHGPDGERRYAEYVERRRRELVRRAAARSARY